MCFWILGSGSMEFGGVGERLKGYKKVGNKGVLLCFFYFFGNKGREWGEFIEEGLL